MVEELFHQFVTALIAILSLYGLVFIFLLVIDLSEHEQETSQNYNDIQGKAATMTAYAICKTILIFFGISWLPALIFVLVFLGVKKLFF